MAGLRIPNSVHSILRPGAERFIWINLVALKLELLLLRDDLVTCGGKPIAKSLTYFIYDIII